MKTLYVSCSFCKGMMEVDAETGEVLKKWSPQQRAKDGDTMGAALKKLEEDKKRRVSLFEDKKGEMEHNKKKLEDVFNKEIDRVKKEGIKDPPPNPFDRD